MGKTYNETITSFSHLDYTWENWDMEISSDAIHLTYFKFHKVWYDHTTKGISLIQL